MLQTGCRCHARILLEQKKVFLSMRVFIVELDGESISNFQNIMQISTTSWEIFNVQCDCNVGFEVTADNCGHSLKNQSMRSWLSAGYLCASPILDAHGVSGLHNNCSYLCFWVDYNTSKSPLG